MSNEYKDWQADRIQDLESCLCKVYKKVEVLYNHEMKNEEPNQAVIDILLEIQNKIKTDLCWNENEILEKE